MICPNCGSENDDNAQFCGECGEKLDKEENREIEVYAEKTEEPQEKECPQCGNKNTPDSLFCNKCGYKFEQEKPKCPNCGNEYVKGQDLFCNKCGENLQDEIEEVKQDNQEKHCQICGAIYQDGDTFCGECGAKLDKNPTPNTKYEPIVKKYEQTATSTNNNYDYNNDIYNKIKCPFCGSYIDKHTKKCPQCGEWLKGVSHFGCGSLLMTISIIIAILMGVGGESINIPFIGELAGLWIVIAVFFYLLPSLIADMRGHDSKLAIFIVNLLFGWTFIGWFAALIFAFTGRSR